MQTLEVRRGDWGLPVPGAFRSFGLVRVNVHIRDPIAPAPQSPRPPPPPPPPPPPLLLLLVMVLYFCCSCYCSCHDDYHKDDDQAGRVPAVSRDFLSGARGSYAGSWSEERPLTLTALKTLKL